MYLVPKLLAAAALITLPTVSAFASERKSEVTGDSATVNRSTLAIKTNILEWAATTPNIGAEATLAPKWSLELTGSYNPFSFGNNKKWKHYQVTGEARYWLKQSMDGHFLGLHVGGGEYNISGIKVAFWDFKKDYRYEGWHVRAGVTYGYHWAINHHWSLEALLGLGVVHTSYTKYECKTCGRSLGKETRTFFAPTRLAVNLAYTFGKKAPAPRVQTIYMPGEVRTDTVYHHLIETVQVQPTIEQRYPFVHRLGDKAASGRVPVRYRLDNSVLEEDFSENSKNLALILEAVDCIMTSDTVSLARIDISGFASPEGPLERNQQLAQQRADALKQYILDHDQRLSDDKIVSTSGGEDWQGLRDLVVKSDMVGKDAVINIIDNVAESDRKAALQRINGGRTYRSITDVLYPQLRSACYIDVWYDEQR